MELFGFILLRPYWLLALPVVAAMAFFFAPRLPGLGSWNKAMDPQLLEAMHALGRVVPGRGGRDWLPVIIAGLIAISLLGPAKQNLDGTSFRNLRGLVFVMDTSKSVSQSPDFKVAITAMRQVLNLADGRPAALIVYAGDAYLVSAFTTDGRILSAMMATLDFETVPNAGSRHEHALDAAGKLLVDANIVAGDVILVTDGDQMNDASITYAEAISQQGGSVSTLFVPTSVGPGETRPDLVRAVAQAGGGAFANVRDPSAVFDFVGSNDRKQLEKAGLRALVWRDFGRYLLVFALFPAIAMFRRRG